MSDIYEAIVKVRKNGDEGVLATVVDKEGHGPATLGTKMLVLPDGNRIGTVGGGALEYAVIKKAGHIMKDKNNQLRKYLLSPDNDIIDGEMTGMQCGGSITVLYEYVGSGARLYIFGAGHIGQALTYHLKDMNYFITMIDSREDMLETIDNVQRRVNAPYESVFKNEKMPPDGFFIVATHSHALDYVVLKRIYESGWNPKYVGVIASKRKAPDMRRRLLDDLGNTVDLETLYSPIGLDIGGQTPDEIVISIISEVQAVRHKKEGHKHMKLKVFNE